MRGALIAVAVVLGAVLLLAGGASAQGFTMRFSGDIIVPRETVHEGPVMTMNGRIIVDGTLRGDALTMNGDVSVTGTVTGSVRTFNGNVQLASTAVVGGDVWSANGRIERAPGAQVRGRISREPVTPGPAPQAIPAPAPAVPPLMPAPPGRPWDGTWYLWWPRVMRAMATATMLGLIVLAALFTAVFPAQTRRVANALAAEPGESLLAGIAVWILLPPLAVVLALSIVGIPAVVFLPFAVMLVGIVGIAGVALFIGERVIGAFQQDRPQAVDVLVGAALLGVLAFVPGLGWLAMLLAVTWGIGAVVLLLIRHIRGPAPRAVA